MCVCGGLEAVVVVMVNVVMVMVVLAEVRARMVLEVVEVERVVSRLKLVPILIWP